MTTPTTPATFCHADTLDADALDYFLAHDLSGLMIAWRQVNDAGDGDAWGPFGDSTPAEAVEEEDALLIHEYPDGSALALTRDARLYLVCDSDGPWACEIADCAL